MKNLVKAPFDSEYSEYLRRLLVKFHEKSHEISSKQPVIPLFLVASNRHPLRCFRWGFQSSSRARCRGESKRWAFGQLDEVSAPKRFFFGDLLWIGDLYSIFLMFNLSIYVYDFSGFQSTISDHGGSWRCMVCMSPFLVTLGIDSDHGFGCTFLQTSIQSNHTGWAPPNISWFINPYKSP